MLHTTKTATQTPNYSCSERAQQDHTIWNSCMVSKSLPTDLQFNLPCRPRTAPTTEGLAVASKYLCWPPEFRMPECHQDQHGTSREVHPRLYHHTPKPAHDQVIQGSLVTSLLAASMICASSSRGPTGSWMARLYTTLPGY